MDFGTEIIKIIPQAALVVIFAYFLNFWEQRRVQTTKENHDEWRAFMKAQRAEDVAAINHLADEISKVTELLTQHDLRVRERLAQYGIGELEESPLPRGRERKDK